MRHPSELVAMASGEQGQILVEMASGEQRSSESGSGVVLKDEAGTNGSFTMVCREIHQQPSAISIVREYLNGWKLLTYP